jgi:5'-nucleotidase (lipoprotein e(P4) family)
MRLPWTRGILLLACVGFAAHAQSASDAALNATLWMQSSVEYRANTTQTYHAAERALSAALRDRNWTAALEQSGHYQDLPPAVVLDLDETVLDNSCFQAKQILDNAPHSEAAWEKWVEQRRATIIDGAREFLEFAHMNGVAAVYITNRVCDPSNARDATVDVLARNGIGVPPGQLMCKSKAEDPSDKSPRRTQAASRFRIVLLLGDDFNDFLTVPRDQATLEGRAALFDSVKRWFGDRWFLLPNPVYGSWERLFPTVESKRKALKP